MTSYSRNISIDICKALAIILVVIGHSSSPFNGYIYLFHVPAFFFFSGYVTRLSEGRISDFVYKRIASILVPFLIVNILFIGYLFILMLLDLDIMFANVELSIVTISSGLKNLFITMSSPVDIGGATWFLVVLFLASIFGKVVVSIVTKMNVRDWIIAATSIISLLLGYYFINKGRLGDYQVDLAFIALFYYLIGYLIGKHEIFNKNIHHLYAIPIAVLAIYFYGKYYFHPMNWPTREFSIPRIHNVITSLSGIYLLYVISTLLTKVRIISRIFSNLGRRSISVLFFHFLGFKLGYVILYMSGQIPIEQLGQLVPPNNNNYWLLLSLVSIVFCLGLDYLIRKNHYLESLVIGTHNPLVSKRVKKIVYKEEKNAEKIL